MSTLADKIKSLRKQTGLTQKELAEFLNLTRSTVANWETGRTVPTVEYLHRLSQVFETSANYLVDPENASATEVFIQEKNNLSFLGILPGDRLRYFPGTTPSGGTLHIIMLGGRIFAAQVIEMDGVLLYQSGVHSFYSTDDEIEPLGRVVKLERKY